MKSQPQQEPPLESMAWEVETLLRRRDFTARPDQPGQSAVFDTRRIAGDGKLYLRLEWLSPRQETFWAHFTYRIGDAWAEFGLHATLGRYHDSTGYWRITGAEQVAFLLDNWVTLATARAGLLPPKPPE